MLLHTNQIFYSEHVILLLYKETIRLFHSKKGGSLVTSIHTAGLDDHFGFPEKRVLVTSVWPGGFPIPGGLLGLCRGAVQGPEPPGNPPFQGLRTEFPDNRVGGGMGCELLPLLLSLIIQACMLRCFPHYIAEAL